MKSDKNSLLLYAVTDRSWLNGKALYEEVEKAINGGVTFVQLREKNLGDKEFLSEALEIKKLCKNHNIPFVVNDNVEIAMKTDADGVHVGQSDMNVKMVKKLLGQDKIVGVSVQTVKEALLAEDEGADYLGVGAVFSTNSKKDAGNVTYEVLKEICSKVKIPVVAIGGIDTDNILKLNNSGISGIAVISAIFAKDNIKQAAKDLKKLAMKVITND